MSLIQRLFGGGNSAAEVKELIANGAILIDVRSAMEFKSGHVKGSKNIPLQNIQNRLNEIQKMNKKIILCCASGNRSGQVENYLKAQGVDCINGGGWRGLNG
jgi:phage shock protein E